MLPIARLPEDRARALAGVCFDIDDTVTDDGVLNPDAYQGLFALRDAGLTLVAVTGRPLGWAELVARQWPVHAAVGENGAGCFARVGRELRSAYWDCPQRRAEQRERLDALCERVARELPQLRPSSDSWARRCDRAFDIGESVSVPAAEVEELVRLIESAGARATVSSVHAHAQLGDHDKARGAARALEELLGVPAQRAQRDFLFVGDSGNDAAAFAWFETTVGVANVRSHLERLPAPPRYVTQASRGAGFAELAATLLEKRAR